MADTDKLVKVGQLDTVADAVIEVISDTNERLGQLGSGVSTEVRTALYTLLSNVAFDDNATYTDELAVIQSWATECTAVTLSASTASISGSSTVTLTATTTPAGGTVTWTSSNTAVATVSSAGVVTGVSNGSATITATCGDVSATCAVTVSGFATLTGITATFTQSGAVYDTDTLDSLKANLVVTANYDNSTSESVSDYTLSGTLAEGTSTITASYGGFTDTFTVNVTSLTETVTVSWSGSGAEKTSSIINATAANVYWSLPFVEGYEGYASSATEDSDFVRISARLYSDAEATTLVGNWHIDNQTIETSGRTTINQPSMPVDTETMVAPAGYYVVLRATKRGGFTSNGTCGTFLNTYATDVKLMATGGV